MRRRLASLPRLFAAAALWHLVAGQIIKYTGCDPKVEDDCDPNPALASTVDVDFTKRTDTAPFEIHQGKRVQVEADEGAVFVIETETQSPTLVLPQYIFFGRVEIILRSARGKGIITSLMLQSDTLDEIYFEWIGSDSEHVQTNYVRNGNATGFDRGANHTIETPAEAFHNYTLDWDKDRIAWFIDGSEVRQLAFDAAQQGAGFPQTPAKLTIGTWVAGRSGSPEGTIEWAGGMADFDDGPFIATVRRVKVVDYANGVDNATEYSYSNNSTMWESIDVKTGERKPDLIDDGDGNGTPNRSDQGSSTGGLGAGTIAGIVVGAVAGCAIISAVCFVLGRRRKGKKSQEENAVHAALLMGGGKSELDGRPSEKPAAPIEPFHLQGPTPQELDGGQTVTRRPMSELGGREIAAELYGYNERVPTRS